VAVAEAMAAGAAPVVSHLACFTDFVTDGENGLVFDHNNAADAPARLAAALAKLSADPALCARLAAMARRTTERYDFLRFASGLLADFEGLVAGGA